MGRGSAAKKFGKIPKPQRRTHIIIREYDGSTYVPVEDGGCHETFYVYGHPSIKIATAIEKTLEKEFGTP